MVFKTLDKHSHLPLVRIAEASRITGVAAPVLRAWEARYGVPAPKRTAAGYRVYDADDVALVAAMRDLVSRGVAPAEASRLARRAHSRGETDHETVALEAARVRLRAALDAWDGEAADRIVERLLLTFGLSAALNRVLLPYLHELGERWARGEVTVSDEHFATGIVRGRLVTGATHWSDAPGPLALLSCAPGESHDIGLLGFGLALHGYFGWRISYLGADTPVADMTRAAAELQPAAVVLSAVDPARFEKCFEPLRELAEDARVAIGGAGASPGLARRLGAEFLPGDPATAARALAAGEPAW
jgi:MerR family transcriptional regulator, light-induced transcriptional regulator